MGFLDRITFQPKPAEPPESIDVTDAGALRVRWPGGQEFLLPAVRLRDLCPCASCVEEGTGRKLLDPATIPADIRPVEVRPVGSYAIQFVWSDGHSTGLYSWETLRQACGLA